MLKYLKCNIYKCFSVVILLAIFFVSFSHPHLAKKMENKATVASSEKVIKQNPVKQIKIPSTTPSSSLSKKNTNVLVIDKDGNSINLTNAEFEYLKDKVNITNETTENINKLLKFYRETLNVVDYSKDYSKLLTRANYPYDNYVHWDNWQTNTKIDFSNENYSEKPIRTGGNPYNFYWYGDYKFVTLVEGDTKGFHKYQSIGQYAYKTTRTHAPKGEAKITGNINRAYDSSNVPKAKNIGNIYNSVYNTPTVGIIDGPSSYDPRLPTVPLERDKIFLGLNLEPIYFVPEKKDEYITLSGNYHYYSTQVNGVDDRDVNTFVFDQNVYPGFTAQDYINKHNGIYPEKSVIKYDEVTPQIIKMLYINEETGELLGQGEYGRGQYMTGEDLSIQPKAFAGYMPTTKEFYYRTTDGILDKTEPMKIDLVPGVTLKDNYFGSNQQLYVFKYKPSKLTIGKKNNKSDNVNKDVRVGDTIEYTITVTNNDSTPQKYLGIEDIFPSNMSTVGSIYVESSKGTSNRLGAYFQLKSMDDYIQYHNFAGQTDDLYAVYPNAAYPNDTQGKYIFYINLDPGETKQIKYSLVADSGDIGETKTNVANIVDKDNNKTGLSAESSFEINKGPAFSITKENSHSKSGAHIGDSVFYTVKVTNNSDIDQKDIWVRDILPSGMILNHTMNDKISITDDDGNESVQYTGFAPLPGFTYSYTNTSTNGKDGFTYYQEPSSNYAQGKLDVVLNFKPYETKTIRYSLKVGYGNIGENKTNTASLITSSGSASSSFKIINSTPPNADIEKSNDKEKAGASTGEEITYKIKVTNNSSINYDNSYLIIKDTPPKNHNFRTDSFKVINDDGTEENTAEINRLDSSTGGIKDSDIVKNLNSNLLGYSYNTENKQYKFAIYIHINAGETKTIEYKLSSNTSVSVGETYTNTAEIMTDINTGSGKKDNSNYTLINPYPIMSLEKKSNKDTAKIGDSVSYKIILSNTGKASLEKPVISDTIPEGMSKPTNIRWSSDGNTYTEVTEANLNGLYYTWDDKTHVLNIYTSNINSGTLNYITYESKVVSGPNKKENIATVTGDNTNNKVSDTNIVNLVDIAPKINIRQEVIQPNNYVVIPKSGSVYLNNVKIDNLKNIKNSYGLSIPSYIADTNKNYRKVTLNMDDTYKGYLPKLTLPSFYEYAGYNLTDSNINHKSIDRKTESLPTIDYTNKDEYWLTIYITPKNTIGLDGPPFYNWDYALNNFGDGNIKVN